MLPALSSFIHFKTESWTFPTIFSSHWMERSNPDLQFTFGGNLGISNLAVSLWQWCYLDWGTWRGVKVGSRGWSVGEVVMMGVQGGIAGVEEWYLEGSGFEGGGFDLRFDWGVLIKRGELIFGVDWAAKVMGLGSCVVGWIRFGGKGLFKLQNNKDHSCN